MVGPRAERENELADFVSKVGLRLLVSNLMPQLLPQTGSIYYLLLALKSHQSGRHQAVDGCAKHSQTWKERLRCFLNVFLKDAQLAHIIFPNLANLKNLFTLMKC